MLKGTMKVLHEPSTTIPKVVISHQQYFGTFCWNFVRLIELNLVKNG